jgi:hypothetical protein
MGANKSIMITLTIRGRIQRGKGMSEPVNIDQPRRERRGLSSGARHGSKLHPVRSFGYDTIQEGRLGDMLLFTMLILAFIDLICLISGNSLLLTLSKCGHAPPHIDAPVLFPSVTANELYNFAESILNAWDTCSKVQQKNCL